MLRLGALLWALALSSWSRASAHGVPPDAYNILSRDAAGLRAVSLSAGIALRRSAQRYQFVCPAAWGDQFASSVAALPDGTLVVGASRGLMLLGDDGTVRAHPDPAAVGRSGDVVRSAYGVFALRTTTEGSELLVVDAQSVRVLWRDPNSMYSLAGLNDTLVLVRPSGQRLVEQVTIAATTGLELDRQTASVDFPVDYVFARADGNTAYALVVFRDASVQLGSLHMRVFDKVAKGELSIAGPLSIDSSKLIALDGMLSQLAGAEVMPLLDDRNVVCLSAFEGITYACERDGITRVTGQGLDEPLFRFEWLSPHKLEQVPEGEARMSCNMQWVDLLSDLQLIGTVPLADEAPEASVPAPVNAGNAGAPARDAVADPAVAPTQPVQPVSSGCTVFGRVSEPRAPLTHALGLLLAVLLVRRRRARSNATELTLL